MVIPVRSVAGETAEAGRSSNRRQHPESHQGTTQQAKAPRADWIALRVAAPKKWGGMALVHENRTGPVWYVQHILIEE